MQSSYDNDVETLLERSIDEIYPKTKPQTNRYRMNRCPFTTNTSKTFFHSSINTTKVRKVQEKSKFNNLLLPEGWIRVFHDSGMFFYCHIATKVVTWSMPYEIQTEPARYHRVPVRSIPCLSVLSQKCSVDDWNNLVKPRNKKEKQKNCHFKDINKVTDIDEGNTVVESSSIGDKVTEGVEVIKEEGEIESSDENGSDEVLSSMQESEPTLPKQYQLNHISTKHNTRSKLSSDTDLSNKRKHSDQESTDSKRYKLPSVAVVDTPNVEVTTNNGDDCPEPITEELDLDCRLLEPKELMKYCERIFTFVDEVRYLPRCTFNKKKNHFSSVKKGAELQQQALLPSVESIVPLTCSMKVKIPNKNLYLELAGRNYSCILNMYCQHAYGITPSFKVSSSLSGIHDFEVVCEINSSTYGVGEGRTKKIAKQKAIHKTLEILIPGFSQKIFSYAPDKSQCETDTSIAGPSQGGMSSSDSTHDDMSSLFDIMELTDPRVFNYTTKLNSISPYNLLTECMNRHCISDSEIKCKIEKQNKHNVFKLIIGDKEVETNCENKREGRQLAAQYMLAKLHPHIQSWGGILRLYGPGSKPVKRFDMQEMQNLLLEDRGGVKNNLINLLRKKMLDLNEEYEVSSDKSKAKFKTSFQSIPIIIFHPDSQVPGNQ